MNKLIALFPARFHEFARYAVSGGTATAIHYAMLVCQVELAGMNETLSTAIGYVSSGIVHYVILYHWVFRSSVRHWQTTRRFLAVATCALALNTGVFWIFLEVFNLWYLAAQVVTTLLVLAVTYTVNRQFTFSRK